MSEELVKRASALGVAMKVAKGVQAKGKEVADTVLKKGKDVYAKSSTKQKIGAAAGAGSIVGAGVAKAGD